MFRNFTLLIILMLCWAIPKSAFTQTCSHSLLNTYSFADSSDIWVDGGSDCYYKSSSGSMVIRDDSGAASSMTAAFPQLDGMTSLKVDFSFIAFSMETGEDFFLEYSLDGGASYTTLASWARGTVFQNNVEYTPSVILDMPFSTETVLRFRCDASSNLDWVEIDDISISACNIVADPCVALNGDSDGDGVCNDNDCEPNDPLYPAAEGTPCDDFDASTENDVVLAGGCDCMGTPIVVDPCAVLNGDSDGDGVCNDNDCEPNDPLYPAAVGTPCDDFDASTENDVVLAGGCDCMGTPIVVDPCAALNGDSDGDGVCNDNDCQPNNPAYPATPGTPCDDGEAETMDDVVTPDGCGCEGTVDPCFLANGDSDGDGTCNDDDCQPNNPAYPATPGSSCNDGDATTENDVVSADGCGCAGIPIITNPGTCVSELLNENNFEGEGGLGIWKDGGSDAALYSSASWAYDGTLSARLRDNSGVGSSIFTDPIDLSDVSQLTFELMLQFFSMENGENLFLEYSLDGGSTFIVGYDWIRGTNFANNGYQFQAVSIEAAFTDQTVLRFRADASSNADYVFIDQLKVIKCVGGAPDPCAALSGDSDGDGVCDDNDCQPSNPAFPATPGSSCNDNDASTENDVVSIDGCGCAGISIDPCVALNGDSDGDGVCDADDCQPNNPLFPATPGVPCNDNDASTENDVVSIDGCGCAGTLIDLCASLNGDSDGDGVCDNDDCQPYNPAIPAAPGTPCNDGNTKTINDVIAADGCGCAGLLTAPVCNFTNYHYKDWEDLSYGFWQDGGHSCDRSTTRGVNGGYSVRLKDNDGAASSTYTDIMNLSNVSRVEFNFMVLFQGMEQGEDLLLEYSTNGGSTYQTAHQWISGVHLFNKAGNEDFTNVVVEIATNFSSQTRFRFRCDATSALDQVYLDDIYVNTCTTYNDPYAGQRPTYRTIDGTLNNFDNPEYGTVGSTYFNDIPQQYGDGVGSLGGQNRKSPRDISNLLSDEPQDRRDERLLSGITYQFGQFLDHDIVIGLDGFEFAPIPVPSYDPVFNGNGIIPFTRTPGIPGSFPRQQANGLTPYIDASNVYGVDPVRAAWLRTFQDGKLKTSNGNQLPYNTIDGEWDSPLDFDAPRMERDQERDGTRRKLAVVGDFRANEHPNLAAFHLLFVREHNRLCDMLKSQGETDDEIIYQKARKLVGGMMQNIVYNEFLPALGVSLDSYQGYKSYVRADVLNTFATAAYRWHTMVENDIIMRNDNCEGIGPVELPLKSIFSNPEILRKFGPGVLLRGLAFHPQYRTDLKVNNGLRNFLFGQGEGLDLVAINLQRGRDHGLPDYKTVRLYHGGSNISSFSDINSDHEISSRLAKAYSSVNDIDLWAGIFAEPLVPGTSLPPTAIAIVKKQFESLRDGDFYFYKNDPFLTNADRSMIEGTTLAEVLKRNTSAESLPSNIFFKEPCSEEDALEDTRDELKEVCNTHGATFLTSCSSTSGATRYEGTYFNVSGIRKVDVELGFSVRITNHQGESTSYTDDTGCLPAGFSGGNIASIEVVCMSKDPSTVDCTGFAGALFSACGGSPLPIVTTGSYNTEQLKSLDIASDDLEALRVNNGFQVTLYEHDNFGGAAWTYVGPTVLCLPAHQSNKMSSMEVICLSDPDRSNCGFNGVAGAVFLHSSGDPENPGPNDHIGASLGVGDFNRARLHQMNVGDDEIKSVKVNNGYAITLFEHDNFGGNYTVYLGDESDLSTTITQTLYPVWDVLGLFPYTNTITMDSKTSSLKVRCIESMTSGLLLTQSELSLAAKKESSMAKLDVNFNLAKSAKTQLIEKFDGRTGEFRLIAEFDVDEMQDSYSYFDDEIHLGDNIYRVRVIFTDGSEAETEYKSVRFESFGDINVFPNPTSDIVNINIEKFMGKDVDITVFDLLGRAVSNQRFSNLSVPVTTFDMTNTLAGSYIVKVTAADGEQIAKKFTVVK